MSSNGRDPSLMTAAVAAMSAALPAEALLVRPMEEYDVEPLHDYVLLRVDKSEQRTAGGLVVPQEAQERRMPHHHVLAVGPGAIGPTGERIAPLVKVGDRVLVQGQVAKLPNGDILTKEEFLMGRVTPKGGN